MSACLLQQERSTSLRASLPCLVFQEISCHVCFQLLSWAQNSHVKKVLFLLLFQLGSLV